MSTDSHDSDDARKKAVEDLAKRLEAQLKELEERVDLSPEERNKQLEGNLSRTRSI